MKNGGRRIRTGEKRGPNKVRQANMLLHHLSQLALRFFSFAWRGGLKIRDSVFPPSYRFLARANRWRRRSAAASSSLAASAAGSCCGSFAATTGAGAGGG